MVSHLCRGGAFSGASVADRHHTRMLYFVTTCDLCLPGMVCAGGRSINVRCTHPRRLQPRLISQQKVIFTMHAFSLPAQAARLGWLAPAFTLGILVLTASAQAQVTQYSSQASFNAATSGLTTFNFNGYAPPGKAQQYSSGLTVNGVTFTGSPVALFVLDAGYAGQDPFSGSQFLTTTQHEALNVALTPGTTAFGAYFSNRASSDGATITALVNGQSFTFAEPNTSTSAFAGFTSSLPITSLSFSGGTYGVTLDNVSVGSTTPAPVPEASTTVSLGLLLALGGLAVAVRKKKSSPSA